MTRPQPTEPSVPSQMASVLAALEGVRSTGPAKWMAYCPAHADRTEPSLSLRVGGKQPVVLHCFAGCSWNDVFTQLNKRVQVARNQHRQWVRRRRRTSRGHLTRCRVWAVSPVGTNG